MWNSSDDQVPPQPVRLSAGSGEGFMSDLTAACRLLRSMHLRCSLFMVRPTGISVRTAVSRLVPRLEAYGPIGIVANDEIGFLHLDRCLIQEKGDDMIADHVSRHVSDALAPGTAERVLTLHYWTDELVEPGDLLRRLEESASRSRARTRRWVASVP
jgi:hypothetical protein